jgi:AcrR family transcriptional regulator
VARADFMKRRPNRNLELAAESRAALIAAARKVFAKEGFDAPLSLVAKRAKVGQGTLYRHFPERAGLALAVFGENIVSLEKLAADDSSSLDDVLELLTQQVSVSTAFIDMINSPIDDKGITDVASRMRALLELKMPAARRAGKLRKTFTTDDMLLAIFMLAGVLAKSPAKARPVIAKRVWGLLRLT